MEVGFDLPADPEPILRSCTQFAARLAAVPVHPPLLVEHAWEPTGPLRISGLEERLLGLGEAGARLRAAPEGWMPAAVEPGGAVRSTSRFLLVGASGPDADSVAPAAPRVHGEPLRGEPPRGPFPPVTLPPGAWAALQAHWAPGPHGELWTALRVWCAGDSVAAAEAVALGSVVDRLSEVGIAAEVEGRPWSPRLEAEWRRGEWRRLRPRRRWSLPPARAALVALAGGVPRRPDPARGRRHTVLFGCSGSGKSSYLVHAIRARLRSGAAAVVFDVHGDLAGRVAAGLSAPERLRLVAVDAASPPPVPGVRLLGARGAEAEAERNRLLAALKRLGADEGGVYWGFRLDRVFDTLLAVVQEEGGDLGDLYQLLTDPARRELARERTRSPTSLRFLDELPSILRRNPEFLWPAAARLSRLMLSPALRGLVASRGPPLPLEALLGSGATVLWRIPLGRFGPEGVQLAVTLLATDLYLRRVASASRSGATPAEVLVVFDEAQTLAPRLLTEMLAEGRKFGLAVIAATQYPERFAPELQQAAAGAVGTHLAFRVPAREAVSLGRWVGLTDADSRELAALPDGSAIEMRHGPGARPTRISVPEAPRPDPAAWEAAVARTREEFGGELFPDGPLTEEEERLMLERLAGAEARAGGATERQDEASRTPAESDAAPTERLVRRGLLVRNGASVDVTLQGRAAIGFAPYTGATRESAEHRRLILEAFRLFARHGHRLEVVRQGRFDARLPDARLLWVLPSRLSDPPIELGRYLERSRLSWAWRAFGGRNVHVEAEVTGADRPERIRHGLGKARAVGAYALFVVADSRRACRVRSVLREAGAFPHDARVWVLRSPEPESAVAHSSSPVDCPPRA